MPQRFGRPPSVPHVLLPLLVIGCGGHNAARDSAAPAPDAPPALAETGTEAPALTILDARAGLASGAGCDAAAACHSGACVLGTCSDWAHALRIAVDTTPGGADIGQAVADFPLLIRLRAASFDFRQARADGADVRFVDAGGRPLAHQKERWDAELGVAELWVSVPRIEPNRRNNIVLMYWGNPQAASVSSAPQVFGALTCALHMDAASSGVAANLQDASGKGNTVNLPNRTSSSSGTAQPEGIAGPGLGLDGNRDYVFLMETSQSPQGFAVSLWLKTTSSVPASIADFASNGGILLDRTLRMDERGRLSFGVLRTNGLVTVSSLTGYNDGAWHHVVARSGDNGQCLFVDGEPIADNPNRSGSTNTGFWYFGGDPPPAGSDAALPSSCFAGTLDEIQLVIGSEPSDDWIKLSYATQRSDPSVLSYQALP